MSELFKVESPSGVNLSLEPTQTPPNFWNNCYNVSFQYGMTRKASGYEQGLGVAVVTPDIVVPLRDDSQTYYWWGYVGLDDTIDRYKMYKIQSTEQHDEATPDTGPIVIDADYQWTGDTLNGVPYMTYGVPYYWDSVSDKFKMFDNIPRYDLNEAGDNLGDPRVKFKSMRTYRNFMIGMNFQTGDYAGAVSEGWGPQEQGSNQNGIWWSHSVVGKNIDVSWKDAEPLDFSGWNYLGGSGGPVIDGKVLRDSFIIYRERSVWQMTYTGGVNVMAFKELFDDAGVLGLDCVAEIEGQHLVVGQSDVYMHNGVRKQSIADGVIRRDLFRRIHPDYQFKVFIVSDFKNKQAWICIPDTSKEDEDNYIEGACNTAFVYNWVENTWAIRDIPNLNSSIYSILSIATTDVSWDSIEEGGPVDAEGVGIVAPGTTWEELGTDDTWSSSVYKYKPSDWGVVMASEEGKLFTSIDESLYDGQNTTGTFEKTFIEFGERLVSKYVSRIYPLVRNGVVEIYGDSSRNLTEGVEWEYLGTFDPEFDEHLSCRLSGRYFHIKFVIPETSSAEFKGYWVEFDYQGRR